MGQQVLERAHLGLVPGQSAVVLANGGTLVVELAFGGGHHLTPRAHRETVICVPSTVPYFFVVMFRTICASSM